MRCRIQYELLDFRDIRLSNVLTHRRVESRPKYLKLRVIVGAIEFITKINRISLNLDSSPA